MIAVASDQIGSAPDLVDPSCIYPTGDVQALTAILTRLATDERLMSRLQSEARARISRWGLAETANGFIEGAERAVRV